MRRYAAALLLACACTSERVEQVVEHDTLAQVAPDTMLAPPLRLLAPVVVKAETTITSTATPWQDTLAGTVRRGRDVTTTTVVKQHIVDSTWAVTLPAELASFPYGVAQMPMTALCDTAKYGFTATIVGVPRAPADTLALKARNAAVTALLDQAAKCKARILLRIARPELGLPLDTTRALRELKTWDKAWSTHPATLGFHLGDDIADVAWGGTIAERAAKWERIACGAQSLFGSMKPFVLRARPTQMQALTTGWRCMTTGIAQWNTRLGDPAAFFAAEIAAAKSQGLGVITALNLLQGQCFPAPKGCTDPLTPQQVDVAGRASIADKYVCGWLSWTWGGNYPPSSGPHYHEIAANLAVNKKLAVLAAAHPRSSCI